MKKIYPLMIEIVILLLVIIIISVVVAVWNFGLISLAVTIPAIYLVNVSFIIYILLKERRFETKISWLAFVIIVPIIGIITFLFLGRKSKNSISKIEYETNFDEFSNPEIVFNEIEGDVFKNKIASLTKKKWKTSNFEIEKHSFVSYEKLFKDLKNAKHHIHIEMYIIKPSEVYDEFKSILINKIKEGIEVRIIIDDFGKWGFSENEIDSLIESGISVSIFNKVNFPFMNINQSFRLHRKIIIIDGTIVHTGGLNISDEYYSFNKKYGYWVDVNTRITGEECNDFSQLFLFDWFKFKNEKLLPSNYVIKQINNKTNADSLLLSDGPDINEYILEESLAVSLMLSTKKIRISTPYFIPSRRILEQLKFALLSGVEVEIFIPGLADKKLVLEATHIYLNELILAGAKVYKLNNMFLHSKMATFDNKYAYLGTINWDMRTFFSNYESLNFLSGDIVSEIDILFDNYKEYSISVNPITKKRKTPYYLFKLFIIKSLAPLF